MVILRKGRKGASFKISQSTEIFFSDLENDLVSRYSTLRHVTDHETLGLSPKHTLVSNVKSEHRKLKMGSSDYHMKQLNWLFC